MPTITETKMYTRHMMVAMKRRQLLTLTGAVGLTGLAGCVGGENGQLEYTASPAMIPDAGQQGYEVNGPEEIEINEEVQLSGVSRDVHISTYSSVYADPDNQTSVFLFSTPDVSVAGFSVNPLARLSGADLIARIIDEGLGRAGGDLSVKEVEQVDEVTVPVLGEDRAVPIFSAVLEAQGTSGSQIEGAEDGEIPIRLYLLSITHDEDVLLAVGFHPESVEASEDIQSLMSAIEHPVGQGTVSNSTTTS